MALAQSPARGLGVQVVRYAQSGSGGDSSNGDGYGTSDYNPAAGLKLQSFGVGAGQQQFQHPHGQRVHAYDVHNAGRERRQWHGRRCRFHGRLEHRRWQVRRAP